jgi:hypothetical protein
MSQMTAAMATDEIHRLQQEVESIQARQTVTLGHLVAVRCARIEWLRERLPRLGAA